MASDPLRRWSIKYICLLIVAFLLVGCAEGEQQIPAPATNTSATASSSTEAPTTAPATVAPTPTTEAETAASDTTAFAVETLATGLDTPWALAFAPDGRIFLTERPGRVRVIQNGQLLAEPVAVIDDVAAVGESGLHGIALDPNFAENRYVYLYYTYSEGSDLRNRVVRYTESNNRLSDPQILLDTIPGSGIHDGGRIAFGPDGKLYITAGDAANGELAQDLEALAGKIHRINPDGSIPADNPFPGSPIYSYGHRNPQGLAWQPDTGQLYATEHGPSAHDEINRIVAGANYGWPIVRGAEHQDPYIAPVLESGDDTWAPAGATFISSDHFAQWHGNLLFAGLRSQTLWRLQLNPDGSVANLEPLLRGYGRLRAVVQGPDGFVYVITSNRDGRGIPQPEDDRLLRLVPR